MAEYSNKSLTIEKFYPANLVLKDSQIGDNEMHLSFHTDTTSCNCPKCGISNTKIHTTHHRKVQDLPILGKRVYLDIKLYEFDCQNPECAVVSFTETLDKFLNSYSSMTERLVDLMVTLAMETSCEGAARILKSMNVKTSGDTVIRTLIKRYEQQPKSQCGSVIGIDDFSFKKRFSYGTIIVDEESHKPVAILDGRDGDTLKEWLKNNKHVKTVTRDRASAYAKAVEEILPDCMQVADRFHLQQNLLESFNKVLNREIPATTAVESTNKECVSCNENKSTSKKNHSYCG